MTTYRLVSLEKVGRGGPALVARLRGENGESTLAHVTDFRPYYWAEAEEKWDADGLSLKDTPVEKKVMDSTFGVQRSRGHYDFHCEADIPYPRRWMIDNDVYAYVDEDLNPVDESPDIPLRKVYWDIEVAEPEFKTPEETGHIIMVTLFNEHTGQFTTFVHEEDLDEAWTEIRTFNGDQGTYPWEVRHVPTETQLLEDLASWIRNTDLDLLLGYNSDDYDWPMVLNRAREIGATVQGMSSMGDVTKHGLPGAQLVDVYTLYDWTLLTKERDSSLQTVAARNGYREYPELGSKVYEYYQEGCIDELLEYNALDVEATWFVDVEENLSEFALVMQEMVGTEDLIDVTKASVVTDLLCLREGHGRSRALPSKGNMPGAKGDYEGGEVMSPKRGGVIDKVAVYDFSRMFPNLIIQLNISPEKLKGDGVEADWVQLGDGLQGYEFEQDEQGLLAAVVEYAFELRDYCERKYEETGDQQWDDRAQATKKIINGIYGAQGFKDFRLYDRRVAETVTGSSRCLIQLTKQYLEKRGWEVIYGDTDSVMVPTEDPWETEEDVQWAVEQACNDMGIDPIEIEFEKWYNTLLLVPGKKKRYAGYIVWDDGEWLGDPKLQFKGFAKVRSNSPRVLAQAQEDVFDLMLKRKPRDRVMRQVLEYMFAIASGDFPVEELASAPELSKDPKEYGTYGPALAAKFSNRFFDMDIRANDRVLPVYVESTPDGIPHNNKIAIRPGEGLPDGVKPDYETMATKAVGKRFADLFQAIGWKHEAKRIDKAWDQPLAAAAELGKGGEEGPVEVEETEDNGPQTKQTTLSGVEE